MTVRSGAAGTTIVGGSSTLLRNIAVSYARFGGSGLLSSSSPIPPLFIEARFGAYATTFDPAFKWAQASLSSDNLTVTAVPTATLGTSTRSVLSFSSGKFYCEFYVGVSNNNSGIGICNSSQTTAQSLGATLNALGYFANGTVRINSATASTIDTYAADDVIGMAVNFDTERIWFKVNDGDWNASGAADPETNVGGIDFSSLNAGPYYAAVECRSNGTNDSFTADFAGAAYQGPGDIVGGATAWWGLRGYSVRAPGTNAVRLREDGGDTEQDFATISTGGLDLAAIATFKGANDLFVVKLYDQVGSNNLAQATAANQPVFTLNGLGSLPIMSFTASPFLGMDSATFTQAQPLTISTVLFHNTSSFGNFIGRSFDAWLQINLNNVINIITVGGAGISAPAADFTWHALQAVFNGASSDAYVDGTSNTGDAGPLGFSGQALRCPYNDTGSFTEVGLWPSAFSTATSQAMNDNQREYWYGAYTGPGDIVGGATAWWGLRAYSGATLGVNAVRLREDGGNTEQNFATIAGGGLDLAAIATFKGANDLFVVTLYDQTGNGNNLTQATSGTQPFFDLNSFGTLPAVSTQASQYVAKASLSLSQPYTFSTMFRFDSNPIGAVPFIHSIGGVVYAAGINTDSLRMLTNNGGSVLDANIGVNTGRLIAWQSIFNAGSSASYINGTNNSGGTIGSDALSGELKLLATGSNPFVSVGEAGIWPVAFDAMQKASMDENQREFWGF